MKLTLKVFSVTLILLALDLSVLYGQFHKFTTKNITLIYLGKPHEYIVPHLGRCFENSLQFYRQLFHYTPSEKTTIYLQDFSDYHNAGATSVPRNFMQINLAPASHIYETLPANERMNWTTSHELVHIVTTDQAAGRDKFFRTIFGGKIIPSKKDPISIMYTFLTSPRMLSPRWYLEGLAVFWETWLAGGLGRALGAYDEMVFRSKVRDGSAIYDVVGLEAEGTTIDFQVGVNSYLYGTRFVSYLVNRYGPQKLLLWASRVKGSKSYFASQFKKVYGVSLSKEWSRWIEWEKKWQRSNLDSIRINQTTPFRPLSSKALGSVSRMFYDAAKNILYAAVLYPGQVGHIAAIHIDTGKIDKICEVKGPALYFTSSLAYDSVKSLIFYTTDNNRWRDLNVLDLKNGGSKRLMKDARIGDLVFNQTDRSLWGVRHDGGYSTLVNIPPPYKDWKQIYTLPYGYDLFDMDISPDGSSISSTLVEPSGWNHRLILMKIDKLVKGNTSCDTLFNFEEYLPLNFVFSKDGRFLFGSSYYSGVSNIYRYNIKEQKMKFVSNCESGFFRPVPVTDDSLIVMRYTGEGFVPVMIANEPLKNLSNIKFLGNEIAKKYPVVKDWVLGSPLSVNFDSLSTGAGSYNSLTNMRFISAYPIIKGYKNFASAGMHCNFLDKLGWTGLEANASYTPNQNLPVDERFHFDIHFFHWDWKISAVYNVADFYDLFGPTKTSRKGYSLGIDYHKTLLYDKPKTWDINFGVTGYGGLEILPDYQNVAATFDKLLSTQVTSDYRNVRRSLGAVDEEKGLKWQLVAHNNYVNTKLFPQVHTDIDYGISLPIGHSSIWLRSSAGTSVGDKNNPFANFFFGGFGNNWVDYSTEKRYREYYSFPGVNINEFGGKNYGKLMLEWNLPPIRFRKVGVTSLYLRWARIALFSSAIKTNFGEQKSDFTAQQFGASRSLINVGGQVDFRLVILSWFNSTFSLGYAAAFEENQKTSKEFMISLKIL